MYSDVLIVFEYYHRPTESLRIYQLSNFHRMTEKSILLSLDINLRIQTALVIFSIEMTTLQPEEIPFNLTNSSNEMGTLDPKYSTSYVSMN